MCTNCRCNNNCRGNNNCCGVSRKGCAGPCNNNNCGCNNCCSFNSCGGFNNCGCNNGYNNIWTLVWLGLLCGGFGCGGGFFW